MVNRKFGDRLTTEFRPVNESGERVTPSDLLAHRGSHEFKGPCCMCAASQGANPTAAAPYTEASIFVPAEGPFSGEYVAACAHGNCRYWGELLIAVLNGAQC
jgi:hypothetical protein